MAIKIQPLRELKAEMQSVVRGARRAPEDAAQVSFESVEAVVRLLTPENRELLSTIEKRRPKSIAELAKMIGRAEPNVSRTLSKLVATGFVRMRAGGGRSKVPEVAIHTVTVNIDVCGQVDQVAVT